MLHVCVAGAIGFILLFGAGAAHGALFGNRVDYAGFDGPKDIITVDVDGDGDDDLIIANQGDLGDFNDSIVVLLNTGDGVFDPPVSYKTGWGPYDLCAGDLDGDGDPDVAVTNRVVNSISVMINDGTGAFAKAHEYDVDAIPWGVCAADFDGDGDADLAVSKTLSMSVAIFLNAGDASFYPPVDYAVGEAAQCICTADLDGDGDHDLAVGTAVGIDILANTGEGTFSAAAHYTVNGNAYFVAAGDIDADDDIDLVVSDLAKNSCSLIRNAGDGTFGPREAINIGDMPDQLAISDLDHDSDADILVAYNWTGKAAVLLNDGSGLFTIENVYDAGDRTVGVCIADFDDDGDADFAATNTESDEVTVYFNLLYSAKAAIEPDTTDYLHAFAPEPVIGTLYVGEFQGGYPPGDIDVFTVQINDTIPPWSFAIIADHPGFEGELARIELDLRGFVGGYGLLWDTADYFYRVTGEFTNGTPWSAGGPVVILGLIAGDVDGNRKINIGDPVAIIGYLYYGGPAPAAVEVADLNGSGDVDLGDAIYLINYIFWHGPAPTPPE